MAILPKNWYIPIFASSFVSKSIYKGTGRSALFMSTETKKKVVQYIFLRRDLTWPNGAMATQAAHASVAAIAEALNAGSQDTKEYISPENLPRMTKYVYGVDDVEELQKVRNEWNQMIQSLRDEPIEGDSLECYWWVEQPENIPSAMATWPIARTNKVSKVIKNLNLDYF